MSHWVTLSDDEGLVQVPRHAEGGTYVLGGTGVAELNVTYNYGPHIHRVMPGGVKGLDGRRAADTVPALARAVQELGTSCDPDYWKATPGNAGYALSILLGWASLHPEAVWRVT